ncbi:UNVERIFIED_CONTAM: hypothetical protein PYX00_007721 [Menopon gallinae]|uniref:UmuC domain-containing protein n=1 Tax=Menopon gallinae TaxID=328185 RepID=A0AAW2HKA8_9NEOP
MEDEMEWTKFADHPNTIIHIDIDCFYAQVELLKQPSLQDKPVGIKQQNIVVTCNYVARKYGVTKCMLITEAVSLCPKLVLISGEDLHSYRQASNQIHSLFLQYSKNVEKLGLDENFIDVTELVQERESGCPSGELTGHSVGDASNSCSCGCHERLIIGSQIAMEIRTKLKETLGFTSSGGVSYNKLLAKIVSSAHKPNQQTTLFPNGVGQFLVDLGRVDRIPGVGANTRNVLEGIDVRTVKDLIEVDFKTLKHSVGQELAVKLKNLCVGVDNSVVKRSGKPNTIGLQNGFCKISVESDVKEKFRILLMRLMTLVEEDGRIPMVVKVTVRKYDNVRKVGQKETKQSPIPSCLFTHPVGKLTEESTNRLLNIIMGLFHRIVDISQPFHLTLLGVAFTKFQEKTGNRSIASFLLKKRDLSVQSLTSFVSNEGEVIVEELSTPSCSKSESESEAEPSPKKTKLDIVIKKRKLNEEEMDLCSPSKLKVAELNLNGDSDYSGDCPEDIDPEVFRELPHDMQQELINHWKLTMTKSKSNSNSKQSLILKYCIPNKQ